MKAIRVFILLLICTTAPSQTSESHIVQRGETFEIVARRYGMTVDELKQANPWIGGCYTGLKLDIPDGKKKKDVLTGSEALAKAYIEKSKSNYNNGDYKQAIKELEWVLKSGECSPTMKEECEQLLASARAEREKQVEKRNNFWGGIATALVTTAAVAASSAMTSSANQTSSAYSPEIEGWPDRDKSLDYLLDPRLAIATTQQQLQQEYQSFKMQTGIDISFEEFLTIRAQSASQVQEDDNPQSSFSTSDKQSAEPKYESRAYKKKECPHCHGSGKCQKCYGDGIYGTIRNGKEPCPVCFNHDGKCIWCLGKGERY